MAQIYCAYSRRLNEKQGLVRSGLMIVKFGLCDDAEKRLENMKLGWPVEGGGRGPALALQDDWRLADCAGAKRDERHIHDRLSDRWPEVAVVEHLRADMAEEARKSGVADAEDNLNGVGELRLMDRRVVFSPDVWSAELGIVRLGAVSAFEKSCEFLRVILMNDGAGGNMQAA